MMRSMLTAVVVAGALASSVYAEDFSTDVSSYWKESATDSSGNYSTSVSTTVSGGKLIGAVPTSSGQSNTENDVTNYVRTNTAVAGAYYNGSLLGDLSGKIALTATFSLNTTGLASGAAFNLSNFVGDDTNIQAPGIRLVFRGATDVDASTPNMWWSNPTAAHVTSMNNGQDVTLTVAFDPSQWSNYYGHVGNESPTVTGQFTAALSDVSSLGLSFGSGYFFSNGFRFNTGEESTGSIQINSINTVSAVPLPASAWGGLALLGGLAVARRRKPAIVPA